MNKLYCVTILWQKTTHGLTNISFKSGVSTKVLWASNPQEALGLAYELSLEDYKEYKLEEKGCFEIPEATYLNKPE